MSLSPRTLPWLLLLPLTATGQAPAPGAPVKDPALESHRQMLELLQEVERRTYENNAYLGQKPLREVEAELETTDESTPKKLAQLRYTLGLLELTRGDDEAAIEHLEGARSLVEGLPEDNRPPFADKLMYNLGVAYMVLGEDQNCVARHTSESCILPIGGSGVHANTEGSQKAIECFTRVLAETREDSDTHLGAMWLMNIAYMTLGRYPDAVPEEHRIPPETFVSDVPFPRFTDIAPALGLNTFSLAGGAAAEDYDLDGDLDLVDTTWDTAGQTLFFENQSDGSFVDRTAEAGLTGLMGGLNLNQADYDGDGDIDLLILRGGWQLGLESVHPNSLLENRTHGRRAQFVDVTFLAGMGEVHYPTQTAGWADYDLDGDLDVYIGNEATDIQRYPCQLFQNQDDGSFREVGVQAGVENMRFSKGVVWGDVDGDRYPDLYVSNFMQPNRLYRNQGDGSFKDVAVERGVERPLDSFPCWMFDFDNDGALDIYVASYYQSADEARIGPVVASHLGRRLKNDLNKLYKGDGRGNFRDVAGEMKLDLFTVVMGSNYGDLDNDGFPDFYLGTGYPFYDGLVPNVMYWNRRGKGFADVTFAGGFGHLQKGHGVVFADLDQDGDQDVFEDMGGGYPGDAFGNLLFENPGFGNHWLRVRLVGTRSNRQGVGARIRAEITEDGKARSVYCTVSTGSSFGCNPLQQHLGLGKAAMADVLEVVWPTSGTTQTFRDLPADRLVRITEGSDELEVREVRPAPFRTE